MNQFHYDQMNLAIFRGQDAPGVLWQPRLEFWYEVNKKCGRLPPHLANASLNDVYDYCHASIRYFTNPLRVRYHDVEIRERWLDEKNRQLTWLTPLGELKEVFHYDEWNLSAYNHEYRLKTPQDFAIWEYVLQHEEWWWDSETFERDVARVDGRGAPQLYFRRSPIQGLFIENMGFEATILMMNDHPEVIERYVEIASAADDALYQVLCNCPVEILNYGENIDHHMDSPTIWRKWLLPYYEKRTAQLHSAGKKTYIHVDGAMKRLIREVRASPFTGIEACTPLPQGDVTLEEIKDALGEKILIDGIPAVYFLPMYPIETLLECTERIVAMFHPRLVLGISDEIPPDGDIERVRQVGELVSRIPLNPRSFPCR